MIPALLIVLAVLQALDGFTTRRILDQGGRELNPVMRLNTNCAAPLNLAAFPQRSAQ